MKRAVFVILLLFASCGLYAGGYGYSPTYYYTLSVGTITASGTVTGSNFVSTVATGTAPFASTSTTLCTNLNADTLDGISSAAFGQLAVAQTWTSTTNWFQGKTFLGSITGGIAPHDNVVLMSGFGFDATPDLALAASGTTGYGIYCDPYIVYTNPSSTGSRLNGAAIGVQVDDDGNSRTVDRVHSLHLLAPTKAGTLTVNSAYGLYVERPTIGGTNNIGIYNADDYVGVYSIQSGVDSIDGEFKLYSEQGATDYTATIKPHRTGGMTSDMTLYLPADEPSATSFATVDTNGQLAYTATSTIPTLAAANSFTLSQKAPYFMGTAQYDPDLPRSATAPSGWPQTAANAQDNEFAGEDLTIEGTCDIVHNGTGTSTVTSTAGEAFAAGDDGKLLYLAGIPYTIDSVTSTSIVEVTEAGALPADATGVAYIVGRDGYWTWDSEGAVDARAAAYNQTTYTGNLYIDNGGAQYRGGVYGYFTKLLATPDADAFTVTMKIGFPPNQTNGIGLAVTEAGGTNPFGLLVNFIVNPTNGHYDVKSFTGATAWENTGTVATKAIYAAPFQYLRIQRIGTGANQLLMAVSTDGMNWIEVISTGFTMANPLTNVGVIMSLPAEAAAGANHPTVTVDWIRYE